MPNSDGAKNIALRGAAIAPIFPVMTTIRGIVVGLHKVLCGMGSMGGTFPVPIRWVSAIRGSKLAGSNWQGHNRIETTWQSTNRLRYLIYPPIDRSRSDSFNQF